MKLSELCKKLGLDPAKTTAEQLGDAVDALVTRANEAAPILKIVKGWDKKDVGAAQVQELANAAVIQPKIAMATDSCGAEKALIVKLQDQITNQAKTPAPDLAKANERATAAETKLADAEKRAKDATEALTLANSKLTLAGTKATTAETTLANAKTSMAKAVVSVALKGNLILTSEKDATEQTLANSADIGAEAGKILGGKPKLHTTSVVADGGTRSSQQHDPNSASSKVIAMVNETMEKEHISYTEAWGKVTKANPQLVTAMTNEGAPKK